MQSLSFSAVIQQAEVDNNPRGTRQRLKLSPQQDLQQDESWQYLLRSLPQARSKVHFPRQLHGTFHCPNLDSPQKAKGRNSISTHLLHPSTLSVLVRWSGIIQSSRYTIKISVFILPQYSPIPSSHATCFASTFICWCALGARRICKLTISTRYFVTNGPFYFLSQGPAA